MKAYTFNNDEKSELGVIETDGLTFVIDDNYITMWQSIEDFKIAFNGGEDKCLRSIEYGCTEN